MFYDSSKVSTSYGKKGDLAMGSMVGFCIILRYFWVSDPSGHYGDNNYFVSMLVTVTELFGFVLIMQNIF